MIGFLVLALSGPMARGMGATAETWTAAELRRLRRHGWRMINGLVLPGRDVDHLLVGPTGVIVVETKWSSTDWHLTPADENVLAAVEQVGANARSLRLWETIKQSRLPITLSWSCGAAEKPRGPPSQSPSARQPSPTDCRQSVPGSRKPSTKPK